MSKYVNLKTTSEWTLSSKAFALLLPLMLLANQNNEINKKTFIKVVNWIKDYRTWNKYWKELEDNSVLVKIDKNTWMVCPHMSYTDGMSHNELIHKWNEVRNATN